MKIYDFYQKKQTGSKITMLTCYDFAMASLLKDTPLDCILVGDSVSMVMHGYPDTTHATIEMMEMHTKAVKRANPKQFIIADMPFFSYHLSDKNTLLNVKRLIQAGANAIKVEGASDDTLKKIEKISQAGVPVMGHLGLTPQFIHEFGGHKIQGRDEKNAIKLQQQAKALEAAGVFSFVLECIPAELAKSITKQSPLATIGIGAGPDTDGQVLVLQDMLGFDASFKPKFLRHFAASGEWIKEATNAYIHDVKQGSFPEYQTHTY